MTSHILACFYQDDDGAGVTSLTVTIDVHRILLADNTQSETVTAGACAEVGDGLYSYLLTGADLTLYVYAYVFMTSGTVRDSHLGGLLAGDAAQYATQLANLDATVSTRATPANILTTALTESYAADGSAATLTQLLYAINQFLQERTVVNTTVTVNKLDGTTAAMVFTLNDASAPTSITRSA